MRVILCLWSGNCGWNLAQCLFAVTLATCLPLSLRYGAVTFLPAFVWHEWEPTPSRRGALSPHMHAKREALLSPASWSTEKQRHPEPLSSTSWCSWICSVNLPCFQSFFKLCTESSSCSQSIRCLFRLQHCLIDYILLSKCLLSASSGSIK